MRLPDAFPSEWGHGRLEGLGADASDLFKAYCWGMGPDFAAGLLLKSLYLRYASTERITVPMVERFLQEFEDKRIEWVKQAAVVVQ